MIWPFTWNFTAAQDTLTTHFGSSGPSTTDNVKLSGFKYTVNFNRRWLNQKTQIWRLHCPCSEFHHGNSWLSNLADVDPAHRDTDLVPVLFGGHMLVHKFCHPTSHFLADVSNHCLIFLCQISKLQGDLKWRANKTKHKITHFMVQAEVHNSAELTSQIRQATSLHQSGSPSTSFLKLVSLIQANEKKNPVKQGILSSWNLEGRSIFFFRLCYLTQARRASPIVVDWATTIAYSQVLTSLAGHSKDMKAHYGDKSPETIKAKSQTGQEAQGTFINFQRQTPLLIEGLGQITIKIPPDWLF